MKFCLYTNVVSPHQLPLAKELVVKLGEDEFRYIYTDKEDKDHAALKFDLESAAWIQHVDEPGAREWTEDAQVLLCGLRTFDLFERRAKKGLKNLYMTETWFKPPLGYFRLLHPRYFGYVRKLVGMAKCGTLTILPIGVHARKAFAKVGVPESALIIWGYFVSAGHPELRSANDQRLSDEASLRVMWCGRMLDWKRVADIKKACSMIPNVTLDIYTNLNLTQVREEMRRHDVYVLASNAYEGWGAVVSEALEEGMIVLGTNEAGASATILPPTQRYRCGDVSRLASLLSQVQAALHSPKWHRSIGDWSAAKAAERLLKSCFKEV